MNKYTEEAEKWIKSNDYRIRNGEVIVSEKNNSWLSLQEFASAFAEQQVNKAIEKFKEDKKELIEALENCESEFKFLGKKRTCKYYWPEINSAEWMVSEILEKHKDLILKDKEQ